MSQENAQTIEVYEKYWERYIQRTCHTNDDPPDWWWDWIANAWDQAPGRSVLEIGSGPGRDAQFMEETLEARVTRTDAAQAFVDYQRELGYPALRLNVLTDPIEQVGAGFGMVLAAAVFHHFSDDDLHTALVQIEKVLLPGGILAFAQRRGTHEGWPTGKLGVGRYYRYREPWDLWSQVDHHLTVLDMTYVPLWKGRSQDYPWLLATAMKEKNHG